MSEPSGIAQRAAFLYPARLAALLKLDGDEMLKLVAPPLTEAERKDLLEEDGKHYGRNYLPSVWPFEGVRQLSAIKRDGGYVALATARPATERAGAAFLRSCWICLFP